MTSLVRRVRGSAAEHTLATIADVDALPHYVWFILVDETVDGIPQGDFSDFVLTTIS